VTGYPPIIWRGSCSTSSKLLEPMIRAARGELAAVGIDEPPEVVLADGGYWNVPHVEELACRAAR
jgi:hypothetical protein